MMTLSHPCSLLLSHLNPARLLEYREGLLSDQRRDTDTTVLKQVFERLCHVMVDI